MEQVALLTYALTKCGFSNRGRKGADHRIFISALIYLGKTGCWWQHLPPSFGNYKTIHSRFTYWSKRKVFDVLFELISQSPDQTVLRFIDSAFVKCSIAATTGRCNAPQRVIGRTKGGFTTKITAICDIKRRIHQCRVDAGQVSDHVVAREIRFLGVNQIVVADKGYSSQKLRWYLERQGHRHCIAQKQNEKQPSLFNKQHYRKRHYIENAFSHLRRWTRLELRRERIHDHFSAFVMLWCIGTWVRY